MDYNDFELQLSNESLHTFCASAIEDDSVAAKQSFELRTDELRLMEKLKLLEEGAVDSATEKTFHVDFGKELYNKVFTGELGTYFNKCLEDAKTKGEGLRIWLRFNEDAQEIAGLPWEFLHDGATFLVAKRNTLISRLPIGINRIQSSPLESILHMLVVVSNPDDPRIPPLNTEYEQEVILEAVDKLYRDHKMEVDFTEDASFETIEGYLNEKDYHIVHFTGHGTYENGRGYLLFESEDGKARLVDNSTVKDLLAGRSVRLVVLSACQSAMTSNKEAYADLASILIREDIPAVVAMQYSIFDTSATAFAKTFYQAVASNRAVDLALTEARIALKNREKGNGVDFATPVLYLRDPDCLNVGDIQPETSELSNKPLMLPDVQVMNKGFIGRKKELRLLQNDFRSDVKRAAIIHGIGGIGKTVVATRLALKMNRYLAGTFGMKCSAITRPEDILNELNAFLNLAGINQLNEILYQPMPLKVKTAALVGILNQRRFLIILDNFEDCLDEETRSSIADPELREFIQHLLNNIITNTKIIITTRYDFDPLEGRLTGGIEHISLPELPYPQTVWLMNNHRELAGLEAEKKRKIYHAIGGHPWIIGQFARHAASQTVDHLLLELGPLNQEAIDFTLLKKSYSKLDDNARELLLHASVYKEAVPVEALSWIMGDQEQPSPSISETLEKLMNWGLIAKEQMGEEKLYAMHTLVRDFAAQELEKEGFDKKKLLVRVAQYYENVATATGNLWDLLKAREYYYQAEEWEKAHDIVADTHGHLVRWGHMELAMKLLNQSIDTTSGTTQVDAVFSFGNMLYRLGDLKTAAKIYHGVMKMSEDLGYKSGIAGTLHQLGMIHQDQGNYADAVEKYQESLTIEKDLGNKSGIASTLHQLGMIHQDQGNYADAVEKYQESLTIKKDLGDKSSIAFTLGQLGTILKDQGNYEEAVEKYQQCIEIFENLGNKSGIAITLHQLGMIHQDQGNYADAVEKYQESLTIKKDLGDKSGIASTLHQLGRIHQDQGNYEGAVEKYHESLTIEKDLGDKSGIATTLHQLGRIFEEQDKDYTSALEKYYLARSIFIDLKSPNAEIVGNSIARIKENMGEEVFNEASEEIRRRNGA